MQTVSDADSVDIKMTNAGLEHNWFKIKWIGDAVTEKELVHGMTTV